MLFTDCQLWNSGGDKITFHRLWKEYKKIAPDAKLYLFDLAGYGNTPLSINENDVYLIAGWSDKIFDILAALDGNTNALDMIKQIEL